MIEHFYFIWKSLSYGPMFTRDYILGCFRSTTHNSQILETQKLIYARMNQYIVPYSHGEPRYHGLSNENVWSTTLNNMGESHHHGMEQMKKK